MIMSTFAETYTEILRSTLRSTPVAHRGPTHDHRPMNDKSLTTQATLERPPAPEIQGERSQAGCTLAVADDERSMVRSGGGGSAVDQSHRDHVTFGDEAIELDVSVLAAALSRRLYAAGLPITPERAVNFAQALTLVSPVSRRQLYWTARAVFVSSPAHLLAFDRVFASVFGSWRHTDERLDDAEHDPPEHAFADRRCDG